MLGAKWLNRIDAWGAWILLGLILLFVLTGYGMAKNIMDPVFAKYLHARLLPIPLFFFLVVHVIRPIHQQFKAWNIFKNEIMLDLYTYLTVFIVTGLLIWLYFR